MKTLTIVIPVFNEGERIKKTLKTLAKGFSFTGLKLNAIVFADDGSTDNTISLIKKYKGVITKKTKATVSIVGYSDNRGRGYAIRTSALVCNTDYVLYSDADLSIPLSNLEKGIPYMKKGTDLVFGSKKKPGAVATVNRGIVRNIVGYGHSVIASLILGTFAWDYQGGFKLFSKKLIKEVFPLLTVDRWGFDMEVIFLSKKLGYNTVEMPVIWGHIENGSKVKLIRDILRSLKEMIEIRFQWTKGNYEFPTVSIPYPKNY